MQEELDYGDAVIGGRLDVLDVVDQRGRCLLKWGSEPPFHFFRIEAGVLPGDRNHGDIDVGEDVGRRAQDDDRAHDEDEQGQDNKGVRPIQG